MMRTAMMRALLALVLVGCGTTAASEPAEPADSAPSSTPETAVLDTAAPQDAPEDAADAADDAAIDAASPCPPDMVAVETFCIDRYEAPNVKGAKPLAMQTAPDGQKWCAARGKRLCTEAEWVRACEGASKRPYPYGTTYKRGTCTDDKTWIAPNWTALGAYPAEAGVAEANRLYQAEESGARAGCVSEEGVIDLTGNVAEWVERSFPHPPNDYPQVMKGCYWAGCYGGSPPSCSFTNPAHPGTFRTYEAGFRCCK